MNRLIIPVFFLMIIHGCIPPRHFSALQGKHDTCIMERNNLNEKNEQLTVQNTELTSKLKNLEFSSIKLAGDSIKRNEQLVRMKIEYNTLLEKYNKLKASQESLINGSERETKRLLQELQKAQTDLQRREDSLMKLSIDVDAKKRNTEQLQRELETNKARMVELEQILSRKDSLMKELKNKVSGALLGFEGRGLSVTRKNGKVYVSMDEKLLFKSGRYEVESDGAEALKKLARVLEQNPDINVTIEGHTDDVKYFSKPEDQIKDNWDLSVMRATAVVKVLLQDSKINPRRLMATGRSEYLPLETGKTAEARARNRRTEIILSPKLDELYQMLND